MLEILSSLGVKKKSKTFMKEAVIPSILYLNIPEDGVTMEKAVSPNNQDVVIELPILGHT